MLTNLIVEGVYKTYKVTSKTSMFTSIFKRIINYNYLKKKADLVM